MNKLILLLAMLSLSGCANHPILRDVMIATVAASLIASGDSYRPDERKSIPTNPCAAQPEQCR